MTSAPLSGRIYHEWFSCDGDAVAFVDGGRKKYGDVGGWGKEIGGERPRERISGKIIAKFEYDSPCGYDPVEDIREILQASFVRGLLSLSAVFLSPYHRLFPSSFATVLSRVVLSASPSLHHFGARSFEDKLISRHHTLYRFTFRRDLICLKVYRGKLKVDMVYRRYFRNNLLKEILRFTSNDLK